MAKAKKIKSILSQALKQIKPSKEELDFIEKNLKEIERKIKSSIKNNKIKADFFIGGSYAKGTLIRKDAYDIDIFLRFDKKHKSESLSKLAEKILKKARLNFEKIHGSRDYFRVKSNEGLFFEIIPVLKIKKPDEAENITDLSYSHVRYVNKKVKSQRLKDEIRLAKAFCYANKCYGAESYINGFSGYGLELLVYNYKSFRMFLSELSKIKEKGKKVIDLEFVHKNRKAVLLDLNASKLQSPVVLVDPTYKYRNVLAALSDETFKKFQKSAKAFLKNPSIRFFERKKIDFEKLKKDAKKERYDFQILKIKTDKQPGDIAGSKLLKFYNHLTREISKYFTIRESGFEYNQDKTATCFFNVKKKREVLIQGPKINNERHVKRFKARHKNAYIKNKRLFAKKQLPKSLESFLTNWGKKHKKRMKEMSVVGLRLG